MKKVLLLISLISLIILPGCLYKSPTDENVCVVPSVNNPTLTRERGPSINPRI